MLCSHLSSSSKSQRTCSMLQALLLSAIVALFFAPAAEASDTNVVSGAVTSVVVVDGTFWDTYDVTVTITICYSGLEVPSNTVYYNLFLNEDDVFVDDVVAGPLSVCVTSDEWEDTVGGPKTTITVTFAGVSGWFGDDWYVPDTCAAACSDRYAYVGGGVDRLDNGSFGYSYTLINDPTGIGMANTDGIVSLTVRDLTFSVDPPLLPGDSSVLFATLDAPPALQLIPFVATFGDGNQVTGMTLGPLLDVPFIRGDTNSDHQVGLTDVLGTLNFLFFGDSLPCAAAADLNDDGAVGIAEVIGALNFLFTNGPPPAPPFPLSDADPNADTLECEEGSSIEQYLEDHSGL